MKEYRDPTAWAAIGNVMRQKKKRKPERQQKHDDAVIYNTGKGAGGGKHSKVNKDVLLRSRLLRAFEKEA